MAGADVAEIARLDALERQNRFIQDNMRRVFRLVYRVVGNVADAQDLTQEVFIKVLQRQDQLRDPEKAAHWLSRNKRCASCFKIAHGLHAQLERRRLHRSGADGVTANAVCDIVASHRLGQSYHGGLGGPVDEARSRALH